MRTILPGLISIFLCVNTIKGQLTTTQTLTPQQLVQNVLLGGGVTASNITFSGNALQIAKFTATPSTSLGITSGILISTGNASTSSINGPQGPNNSPGTTTGFNGAGDAYLSTLSNQNTFDAGVLEFDFVASGDTVKFRYVFASEEYPEYVGQINDAFALVLSGSGSTTLTPVNIAVIPTTTSGSNVVSINNVNNITNSVYYVNNSSSVVNTEFDGLTKVLTAKYPVICGQSYHIKIAIADGTDVSLDSGVFLEEGSFSSLPPLNLNTTNANSFIPDTILVEDCNTNCINFIRNGNTANADSFNLQVSGNALLGTDYIQSGNPGFTWPTKIYFAANQDTLKFCNLTALQDGLTEGLDTIKFTMFSFATNTVSCASSNSINFNLYIKDYTTIGIAQNDVSVCNGSSTILNAGAGDGYPAYTYTISPSSVNTSTINTGPINSTTVFTITVNDICNKPVTKEITVTPVAIPTIVVNDTVLCAGNSGTLSATGATSYSWSSGPVTSSITVTPSVTTNYTVVGSVGTCSNSAVSTVSVVGLPITISGSNNLCLGQSSTLTASGGSGYIWDTGETTHTIVVTPTTTTSYTASSIAASCTNIAIYTVSITANPTVTVSGDSLICPSQNVVLTASGATSYTWSNGPTTNVIAVNPATLTTYTVIGVAGPSCTNQAVYTVSVIPTPTITVTNSLICGGDNAILYANGASTYTWSTGVVSSSTTVAPMTTTNYTVFGSVGACTSAAIATVTVTNPSINISGNSNICIGQSTILSASGGSTYTWTTGENTATISVSPTTTTTYSVSSAVATCTNPAVHTVSVTQLPVINITGSTICPGQNGTLTVTGATTYTWNTGANTSSISVSPTVTTTYTVSGTTIPFCTNTATYNLNVITDQPVLQAITPQTFCLDSIGTIRLFVSNGNPPYSISWLIPINGNVPFDTINNIYYLTQSGSSSNATYTVIVTDQCLFEDTVSFTVDMINCEIIIPNVITSNGDGVNDYFRINGLENYSGTVLTVFNRWGRKVYNSDDYKNDWSPDENSGTYFYTINLTDGRKFSGFFELFKN